MNDLWETLAPQPGQPNNGLTQRKNEITALWDLFLRYKPKVILEIGTAQGGTFAGWCQLSNADTTLIAIDRDLNDCRPRPGEPVDPDIYSGKLAMTKDGGGLYSLAKAGQTIHGINGWSHEQAVVNRLSQILNGRKVDFLFHDASHSVEMFSKDLEIYWPFVADGGIFATHDINWSASPDCNKREAWLAFLATAEYSAHYEFLPHRSVSEMGIGVLIK